MKTDSKKTLSQEKENMNKDQSGESIEIEREAPADNKEAEGVITIEEALQRISELEETNKELNDRGLRRAAELQNYKKRTEADFGNLLKYAAEPFILKILPVYDDLIRSLNHVDEGKVDSLIDGLKLVADKFAKLLEEQGISKIEAKGKEFDFNLHEALMQRHVEGVAPHTVLEEVEAGYMYKDKVIRHTKVIVSQDAPEQTEGSGEAKEEEK
ncbi:MAG: nucleotide exchange factor GrpE [Bacteroidetes bacterium]|nr:nucleotide exchange factor GrpE [Bacteroidota bacterium]MBU2506470.1 nucleotide exchange factor GrpE [Bacteroidota bacterium]